GSDGDQGNGGVFRSLDRGASWSTFGAGLPVKPRITALALQPLNPAQVVAAAWNPTDGSAGAHRNPDPPATAAPSATNHASATPGASAAAPTPVRRTTGTPAYATYGVALAVLLALGAVILVRRWRVRRDDERSYRP